MKGVALAAGEGTRLGNLIDDKPKPLVQAAGVPILERCFDLLIELGTDGLVVVVGYKREKIIERCGEEYRDVPITYAHQCEQKGLAHALLQAEPYVEAEFLLVHGDNVFAPSAHEDLRSVAESEAEATLLVEKVDDKRARSSAVVVTNGDRVVDVVERPDDPPSNLSVVGFYSLPPEVFEACRRTEASERGERELGDALSSLARSREVRAVPLKGERVNVNWPGDIVKAERTLEGDDWDD